MGCGSFRASPCGAAGAGCQTPARVRLGSALAEVSRRAGLPDADLEALDVARERPPAEPMVFE